MVFLVAPSAPPPGPVEVPWTSCQHTWFGWDGTEWDLSQGLNGVKLLAGTRGMDPPPSIRYTSKAPAVDGSLYRGSVADEREVMWPIRLFNGGGSQAWIEHQARWWKTLDEEQLGTWVITQPSGVRRSLDIRYTGLVDDTAVNDPGLVGFRYLGINLVAEQPHWYGDVVTRQFDDDDSQPYYGGDAGGGYGPPYYISPGSTTASASITNEGDKPAWPVWTVHGPMTTATVGLDGHQITFPMTLTEGQWVRIDTDPGDQVARDQDGNDRSAQLTAVDFARIPKGADVPLSITKVGSGSIIAEIRPRYRCAT